VLASPCPTGLSRKPSTKIDFFPQISIESEKRRASHTSGDRRGVIDSKGESPGAGNLSPEGIGGFAVQTNGRSRVIRVTEHGRIADAALHRRLLVRGARLEYDSAFRWKGAENPTLDLILALAPEYPSQLMLGMDAARRSYWRAFGGGPGLDHLACTIDFLRVTRGTLADARTTIEELYTWQFEGPAWRDFTGVAPSGRRDAGAIEAR